MKALIIGGALAIALFGSASAQGAHEVRGYTKSDGTYVAPHMQSNPNATRADNYSTEGNVNPYTGQAGTKPLYQPAPSYAPRPAYSPAPPVNPYAPKTCAFGSRC